MKHFYFPLLLVLLMLPSFLNAQCDTTAIDQSTYTLEYADTYTGDKIPENAFDGDPATFWNTGGNAPFPHELIIDLGEVKVVNGLSVRPRINSNLGKLSEYNIYLYEDIYEPNLDLQAGGTLIYSGPWQGIEKFIYFGNRNARYVNIQAMSNYDPGNANRLMISEVVVYEDTSCPDYGLLNQVITFEQIGKQTSESADIELQAYSNQGLDVSFEVVEGDGIVAINGSTLSFEGGAGNVILRAYSEGDAAHYPSEQLVSFEVIDLNSFYPTVSSRLTSEFPVIKSAEGVYPVYINASIAEPGFLSIDNVELTVDGEEIEVVYSEGAYIGLWKPGAAGDYEFEFVSTGSNGNTSEVLSKTITVEESGSSMTVFAMDKVLVNFPNPGRTIEVDTILPQFLGTYKNVTAYLDVTCPNISGGCDDWDRKAYLEVQAPNGQWVEIIRYMTPYGVGCYHSADVTDFMDLLQGEVKLRVFVDTWGTGGWDFTLRLEMEEGTPDYLYHTITKVWDKNAAPFGNPGNLQPMETVEIPVSHFVESAKLRLTTTGHGWGSNNTGNAAEFYYATHNIAVNGTNSFEQYLYNVCNPNPDNCLNQQGTWYFERAGWCPGAIAPPFEFDLSSYLGEDSYTLDYIFQTSYMDMCHVNNPNCVSGITCSDCSDNFNPIYMIDGYVINYSNTFGVPVSSVEEQVLEANTFLLSPNPVVNQLTIETKTESGYARFLLIDVAGKIINSKEVDAMALVSGKVTMDLSELEAGTYFVRAFTDEGSRTYKIIKI
jgi:hypothetical protein